MKNIKSFLEKSIDYVTYRLNMAADVASPTEDPYKEYKSMNVHRMDRVEKTYKPSEELLHILQELKKPQTWLVISEYWCGDAAQIVPIFEKMALASEGKINFRLIYRDENLELMDAFLTHGTRSIPKLVIADEKGEVINSWGPRPDEAQEMVKILKANPETAQDYANALHLWYAKDRQKSTEQELKEFILQADKLKIALT